MALAQARSDFHGAKVMLFLGEFLVALRRDDLPSISWPGMLDFPGGGRERHETPETCVIRECFEEIRLRLTPGDLRLAHLNLSSAGTAWYFAAHLPEDRKSEIVLGSEGQDYLLMAPEAFVAARDAIPHMRDILREYLSGL